MPASPLRTLNFEEMANRLLRHLAYLIHSGETTERRLAGQIDVSQPHLHNVLSGTRKLTPNVADQALLYLDWSILDLVDSEEAVRLLSRREAAECRGGYIDFAHSAVGPGYRFPGIKEDEIKIPFPWLERAETPIAIRANTDPEMADVLKDGDTLLIDQAPAARSRLDIDALYVVRVGNHSLARWLRFASRGIYLISQENHPEPSAWPLLVTDHRLDVIEGRIIARAQPIDGKFRAPGAPFAGF